jgi:curved DNA-binding protein CbpA
MARTNYYDILGLKSNSNKEDIKSSFRNLALKYHPDKNQDKNTGSIFIIINNAYQTLVNDESRIEYDKYLKTIKKNNNTFQYGFNIVSKHDPIIEKTLSEFNNILWDFDELINKKIDDNLIIKINETNVYDYVMYFLKYLEKEILSENYRFRSFSNKKRKEKLHLQNYFYLLRVEIEKYIINIDIKEDLDTKEIAHLMEIKNKMIEFLVEMEKYI